MKLRRNEVLGILLMLLVLLFIVNISFINSSVREKAPRHKVSNLRVVGVDYYEFNNNPYDLFPQGLYGIDSVNILKGLTHPSNLAQYERIWMNDLHGLASQSDEDWYIIEITPGFLYLEVKLLFNHSLGNIDIEIYFLNISSDTSGNLKLNVDFMEIGSYSSNNSEYIGHTVSRQGIYFIRVFGQNTGNEYNIWCDDLKTRTWDDAFEINDDFSSAYNITTFEGDSSGISQIDFGIQYNNDFFLVEVNKGFERFRVCLIYDISEGRMGFKIYDYNYKEITGNFTLSDNDYINYILPSNGTYYIRVYGDNSGNTYNLFWEALKSEETSMILGIYLFILFGAIIGISMLILLKYIDRFHGK